MQLLSSPLQRQRENRWLNCEEEEAELRDEALRHRRRADVWNRFNMKDGKIDGSHKEIEED